MRGVGRRVRIPVPPGNVATRARERSNTVATNFIVEGDAESYALFSRPGRVRVATLRDGSSAATGARDPWVHSDGTVLALSDSRLWQIAPDGDGDVRMVADLPEMGARRTRWTTVGDVSVLNAAAADGDTGDVWVVDRRLNVTRLGTEHGFLGGIDIDEMYGTLVYAGVDGKMRFSHTPGVASLFDPLDFVSPEGSPDELLGVRVFEGRMLLLGERTVEMWQPSSIASQPFVRQYPFGRADRGILDNRLVSKSYVGIMYVSNDRHVYFYDAGGLRPVSGEAVYRALGTARGGYGAFVVQVGNAILHAICFDGQTWVFNYTNGTWTDFTGFDRVSSTALVRNNWWFGEGDTIWRLDEEVHTDDGRIYERILRTQPYAVPQQMRYVMSTLTFDMEVIGPSDADDMAYLRVSPDGGRTFTPPVSRSLGAEVVNPVLTFSNLGVLRKGQLELTFRSRAGYTVSGISATVAARG